MKNQNAKDSFTMVENVLLKSPILSSSSKIFYIALKSFKNRKSGRCFPTMRKATARAGIAKNTGYKARKKLERIGLITWTESKGRGHSCSYRFILEDGSSQEQERVIKKLKRDKIAQNRDIKEENDAKEGQKIEQNEDKVTPPKKQHPKGRPEGVREKSKIAQKKDTNYSNKKKVTTPVGDGKKNQNVRKFIAKYCQEFEKQFEEKPEIRRAKDDKLVKEMLKNHSLETLVNLLPYFWRIKKDELIEKNGYTIAMFKTRLNRLIKDKREDEKRWW